MSTHEIFATLHAQAREWFERAAAEGWLERSDVEALERVERATPAELFVDQPARPLVVAFFGGTGVGKSSLLNRVVGSPLARVGPERPTSREVTLYLHRDVELAHLPAELPAGQVRIERHDCEEARGIAWIDAPDIDSTDAENRRCTLAWLPHIDLVIYVVSPERYRDDKGWRILLGRGHKHGWLFVLNRWDEGDQSQRDDFAQMLRGAGFEEPVVLCTCCLTEAGRAGATRELATATVGAETSRRASDGSARGVALPTPDQFEQIERTIRSVLAEHGVRELTRLGHRARLLELRAAVGGALPHLGQPEDWQRFAAQAQQHVTRGQALILQGAEWAIRAAAARLATRETGLLGSLARRAAGLGMLKREDQRAGEPGRVGPGVDQPSDAVAERDGVDSSELTYLTDPLWDAWMQSKLEGVLDAIELDLRRSRVSVEPLRQRLEEIRRDGGSGSGRGPGDARSTILEQVRDQVRTALSTPGTALQRMLRRITGFLVVVLPAAALGWVAYELVTGYYRAAIGAAEYLGTTFAIHSTLLVLVAWALPYGVDRMLRPSLERAMARGMRRGVAEGLAVLGRRILAALGESASRAQSHHQAGRGLIQQISGVIVKPIEVGGSPLGRLVPTACGPGREA